MQVLPPTVGGLPQPIEYNVLKINMLRESNASSVDPCLGPTAVTRTTNNLREVPPSAHKWLSGARPNGYLNLPAAKVLMVERYSIQTQFFLEELNGTTGCSPYFAQSLGEGLSTMKEERVSWAAR